MMEVRAMADNGAGASNRGARKNANAKPALVVTGTIERFPMQDYRDYLELNSPYRDDTRLDPNAVYAKRGVYQVSGRLMDGAKLSLCARAVEEAFNPAKHELGRKPLLVWLACEVGMWLQPHPVRGWHMTWIDPEGAVLTDAAAARHYGLTVETAERYHQKANKAVQEEWEKAVRRASFYGPEGV